MPPCPIPGIFSKGTSPLNLCFCFISFLFEARGLAGLWIGKDENIAVGGPCLAHKPWPENQLRQVGTGSSVFPLIKRRGGADTFLHGQQLSGRWGLPAAPCCSAAVLHPGSCVPRTWWRAVLFLYITPCFPIVPAPWVLLSYVLWFSLPSAGARENIYLLLQC